MNQHKRVIVNCGVDGRELYSKGSLRLIESIKQQNVNSDVIVYSPQLEDSEEEFGEYTVSGYNKIQIIKGLPKTNDWGSCKDHKEVNHQFKAFCIKDAIERGYTQIMWCDSSVVLNKNPEHYFKLSEDIGIVLFDNPGCLMSEYTSQKVLDIMEYPLEEARKHFQCDSCIMLYNLSYGKTKEFLNKFFEYSLDGTCLNGADDDREDFKATRHDQCVISILAKQFEVNYINYGAWEYHKPITSCFIKKGI